MPANFGLLPDLEGRKLRNKQERYGRYRDRALAALKTTGLVRQVQTA
jgi:methylenetetrahydrofolate--tRNA-(uracil-5-)-methyltransferase